MVDRHSLSTAWIMLNERLPLERKERIKRRKKKIFPRKACRIYDVAAAEAVALATEDLGAYEVPLQKKFSDSETLAGRILSGVCRRSEG